MLKELVLIFKRKYEDLVQQKGEGESVLILKNERLINILIFLGDKNGSEDLDFYVMEKYMYQKMDKLIIYIIMKLIKFVNQIYIYKSKKWMKFKMQ